MPATPAREELTITLPKDLADLVRAQVAAHSYESPVDYLSHVVHIDLAESVLPPIEEEELENWLNARDITAECLSLNTFPHRGTARDDLALGIRTMGFRDRVIILFRISDKQQTVSILSILYGGRSLEKEIPYIR